MIHGHVSTGITEHLHTCSPGGDDRVRERDGTHVPEGMGVPTSTDPRGFLLGWHGKK